MFEQFYRLTLFLLSKVLISSVNAGLGRGFPRAYSRQGPLGLQFRAISSAQNSYLLFLTSMPSAAPPLCNHYLKHPMSLCQGSAPIRPKKPRYFPGKYNLCEI